MWVEICTEAARAPQISAAREAAAAETRAQCKAEAEAVPTPDDSAPLEEAAAPVEESAAQVWATPAPAQATPPLEAMLPPPEARLARPPPPAPQLLDDPPLLWTGRRDAQAAPHPGSGRAVAAQHTARQQLCHRREIRPCRLLTRRLRT